MIEAIINSKGSIEIYSTNNNKSATVTDYTNTWQIEYSNNGARKNFKEYHEVLDYLKTRGW